MEVIKRRIIYKSRSDSFAVYPLGDVHIGSVHCVETALEKRIAEIEADPHALWIGMGDLADCITAADQKRFDIMGYPAWLEKDNIIPSQIQRLSTLLEPIKSKCICLLTGNHEETIHRHNQYNVTLELCRKLGVPYGGYACFIDLLFNRMREAHGTTTIRIHAWHGSGAAQTEGARLGRLMRLVNDVEADIYLMGHLHAITTHTPDRLVCRSGKVRAERLAASITGSWLRAYTQSDDIEHPLPPSYAEQKGYKPSRIGNPIIKIHPDTRLFTVES